jgi:membrane protein DedA with SNARE-associated domain
MEELLDKLLEILLPQSDLFLYIFLFISAIIENLFPPIPGDTITAFGAFLVGTSRLNYALVYLSTTVGSVIGFMSLFYLGRYLEREYFMQKDIKYFSVQSILAAEKWFTKYGLFIILANRFMPGIRSVISIVSGISKLSPLKVFLLSLISAGAWNFIWIQAGFMLGNNWDVVKRKFAAILSSYNLIAGIILIAALAGYISWRIWKYHHGKKNP